MLARYLEYPLPCPIGVVELLPGGGLDVIDFNFESSRCFLSIICKIPSKRLRNSVELHVVLTLLLTSTKRHSSSPAKQKIDLLSLNICIKSIRISVQSSPSATLGANAL